jgi:hypothetical protein
MAKWSCLFRATIGDTSGCLSEISREKRSCAASISRPASPTRLAARAVARPSRLTRMSVISRNWRVARLRRRCAGRRLSAAGGRTARPRPSRRRPGHCDARVRLLAAGHVEERDRLAQPRRRPALRAQAGAHPDRLARSVGRRARSVRSAQDPVVRECHAAREAGGVHRQRSRQVRRRRRMHRSDDTQIRHRSDARLRQMDRSRQAHGWIATPSR